ncbi:hypothetical protein L0663_16760 [Dyadobacter sp. CY107]|uniref:hypothetical protein n=1 Tax=Dyadobacter fanqingshengii TaxID=2906443 RepID=UPI001F311F2B|nr:hypothetical protein [Dyadobacter fanqingshengii]MCF2505050.1 hypothetical protein [Dyadobacter fanqingshengii]
MTRVLAEPSHIPKRQAVKVTGITFVLTSIANKISDPTYKDWLVSLCPLIGYLCHLLYAVVACEISFVYFQNRANRFIKELKQRKIDPECDEIESKQLDKEMADMRRVLIERRIKDLNARF